MDSSKLTTRSQEALSSAVQTAGASGHASVSGLHLLAALLGQQDGIAPALLQAAGVDPGELAGRGLLRRTTGRRRVPACSRFAKAACGRA